MKDNIKINQTKLKNTWGDTMYSELIKAFQSNKNCSIYTDDECDKFIYGKVIALN